MDKELRGIINQFSLIRHQINEFIRDELHGSGFTDVETAHGTIFEILLTNPEPVSMNTFVKKTGRAKSTITGVIDTLEARGYVERKPIPGDRRRVGVVATDKCKKLNLSFKEMSDKLFSTVYRDFTDEESYKLLNLLGRSLDNLKTANQERALNKVED